MYWFPCKLLLTSRCSASGVPLEVPVTDLLVQLVRLSIQSKCVPNQPLRQSRAAFVLLQSMSLAHGHVSIITEAMYKCVYSLLM